MQISFSCGAQTVIFKSFTYLIFDFFQLSPDLFSKQVKESSLCNPLFFPPNSLLRMHTNLSKSAIIVCLM